MATITVRPSGSSPAGDFTTLAAALADSGTGSGDTISIEGDWTGVTDTSAATIADSNITITAVGDARIDPRNVGSGTHYKLSVSTGSALTISQSGFEVDGIEIKQNGTGTSDSGIDISLATFTGTIQNCVIWSGSKTNQQDGIYFGDQAGTFTLNVTNSIIFGFERAGIQWQNYNSETQTGSSLNINSCTVYNCTDSSVSDTTSSGGIGIRNGLAVNVFNTLVLNCHQDASNSNDFRNSGSATWNIDYSIASDTSISTQDASAVGCLESRTASDSDTPGTGNWVVFNNLNSGSVPYDLTLKCSGENDAQDMHSSTSGASLDLPTGDILNFVRVAPYSAGADTIPFTFINYASEQNNGSVSDTVQLTSVVAGNLLIAISAEWNSSGFDNDPPSTTNETWTVNHEYDDGSNQNFKISSAVAETTGSITLTFNFFNSSSWWRIAVLQYSGVDATASPVITYLTGSGASASTKWPVSGTINPSGSKNLFIAGVTHDSGDKVITPDDLPLWEQRIDLETTLNGQPLNVVDRVGTGSTSTSWTFSSNAGTNSFIVSYAPQILVVEEGGGGGLTATVSDLSSAASLATVAITQVQGDLTTSPIASDASLETVSVDQTQANLVVTEIDSVSDLASDITLNAQEYVLVITELSSVPDLETFAVNAQEYNPIVSDLTSTPDLETFSISQEYSLTITELTSNSDLESTITLDGQTYNLTITEISSVPDLETVAIDQTQGDLVVSDLVAFADLETIITVQTTAVVPYDLVSVSDLDSTVAIELTQDDMVPYESNSVPDLETFAITQEYSLTITELTSSASLDATITITQAQANLVPSDLVSLADLETVIVQAEGSLSPSNLVSLTEVPATLEIDQTQADLTVSSIVSSAALESVVADQTQEDMVPTELTSSMDLETLLVTQDHDSITVSDLVSLMDLETVSSDQTYSDLVIIELTAAADLETVIAQEQEGQSATVYDLLSLSDLTSTVTIEQTQGNMVPTELTSNASLGTVSIDQTQANLVVSNISSTVSSLETVDTDGNQTYDITISNIYSTFDLSTLEINSIQEYSMGISDISSDSDLETIIISVEGVPLEISNLLSDSDLETISIDQTQGNMVPTELHSVPYVDTPLIDQEQADLIPSDLVANAALNTISSIQITYRDNYPSNTGILSNIPGIILLKGATNYALYSNDLTNAYWDKVVATVTKDQVGLLGIPNTGCKLDDSSASYGYVLKTFTIDMTSKDYTVCFYVKKDSDSSRVCGIQINHGGVNGSVDFRTDTGVGQVRENNHSITQSTLDCGNWWAFYVQFTSNGTSSSFSLYVFPAVGATLGSASAATTGSIILGNLEVIYDSSIQQYRGNTPIFTTSSIVSIEDLTYRASYSNHSDNDSCYYAEYENKWVEGSIASSHNGIITVHDTNDPMLSVNVNNAYLSSYDGTSSLTYDRTWDSYDIKHQVGMAYSSTDSKRRLTEDGNWNTENSYDGDFDESTPNYIYIGLPIQSNAVLKNIKRFSLEYTEAQTELDNQMFSDAISSFIVEPVQTDSVIQIDTFEANGAPNNTVNGYLVTTSSSRPTSDDTRWSGSAPTNYPTQTTGNYTLYAWVRDTNGFISNPVTQRVHYTYTSSP